MLRSSKDCKVKSVIYVANYPTKEVNHRSLIYGETILSMLYLP